jgi:hypothetical protein
MSHSLGQSHGLIWLEAFRRRDRDGNETRSRQDASSFATAQIYGSAGGSGQSQCPGEMWRMAAGDLDIEREAAGSGVIFGRSRLK